MIPEDVKRVLRELKSLCENNWCRECPFWKENGCSVMINKRNPETWEEEILKEEAKWTSLK